MKDLNQSRCGIKEAALDLVLHYLREMKQDEAADNLESKRLMTCQIITYKCRREN